MTDEAAATTAAQARLKELLDDVGVEPIVHAGGTKSSMGGSFVHPDVADVMRAALDIFAPMEELLARVGDATARLLGVEAATVVAGAASGCVLGAAAMKAMARKARDVTGATMVTQRRHVGRYTYLYEQAGCSVREVGTMNDCPAAEYLEAMDGSTVGLAWLEGPGIRSAGVGLAETCALARAAGVPVIVDAAAMAFPFDNVSGYLDAGSDLVVVSGGKLINGPQGSGFVFGRSDLVERVRRLGFPAQGVGRAHKITKEAALGAYAALRTFLDVSPELFVERVTARAERLCARLGQGGVRAEVQRNSRHALPAVVITRVGARTGHAPSEWSARLLQGRPRIFLPFDDALDELCVEFASLKDGEDDIVASRIVAALGPAMHD
jgi:D-glucosaminate-6-phosphate ammonia-lyase